MKWKYEYRRNNKGEIKVYKQTEKNGEVTETEGEVKVWRNRGINQSITDRNPVKYGQKQKSKFKEKEKPKWKKWSLIVMFCQGPLAVPSLYL